LVDQGETVPVIDLPEMPQELLKQLKMPIHEGAELFDDPEAPVDLEMFHSTPVEMVLPDVSEAEIEALFQDAEPSAQGGRPDAPPNLRSAEVTMPSQPSLPSFDLGPVEAAAMSGEELSEILEIDTDLVGDELPWDSNDVVEDVAIESIDEAVLDAGMEVVEVLPEDLDTDAEGAIAADTLPVPCGAPLAKPLPHALAPPVLLATPVVGAAPVAGMPVAGIPRAYAPPLAAAAATPALPVSTEPIPPPTPPTKTPIDDVDLDALLQDALDDAPVVDAAKTPAVDMAHDNHGAAPVVEKNETPDGEDDLDLMSLFEDDDAPELADVDDDDAIEVAEDADFLFDTKPPTESKTKG